MAEPIAIVGHSCRLPGGIDSPEDFWQVLCDKGSGYAEFPSDRINIDAWHHPRRARPGSIVSRGGYFIRHDLDRFDNDFFGLNAMETSSMEPTQKQILEVAYEALESAGVALSEVAGSKTGVYFGNMSLDQALSCKDSEHANAYTSTGMSTSILSNRINYAFGMTGPSLTIDTACSSSLYALHMACAGLSSGDCDSALVCAANAIQSVEARMFSSKLGTLSPTSHCHTFDESADGYSRADAFCGLYIMRLSDALASNRPVRAVIRGTAVGSSGHGQGLTRPNGASQAEVIRQAYAKAGISDLHYTGYFECHGTGTPVGDPIETSAISSVFSSSRSATAPLLIGSVKTNMGHSEGAAGLTAVIKTILALEYNKIPPTIGPTSPNPAIRFEEWKLRIVSQLQPWPEGMSVRRASINSFGFGGANAHAILEGPECAGRLEATMAGTTCDGSTMSSSSSESSELSSNNEGSMSNSIVSTSASPDGSLYYRGTPRIVLCTAKTDESLTKTVQSVLAMSKTETIEDIAYTLSRRTQFAHRAAAIVERGCQPVFQKSVIATARSLGFVFTGQSAQWPQMGRRLLSFPAFVASVRKIDAALAKLPMSPDFSMERLLQEDLAASEIDEPRIAQFCQLLWKWHCLIS